MPAIYLHRRAQAAWWLALVLAFSCSAPAWAVWKPSGPVPALAQPELRTAARTRPPETTCRDHSSGAAGSGWSVKTAPAAREGPSLTTTATSRAEDLANGRFFPVLDDGAAAERRDRVTRLVLCSGKVYYDLLASEARAASPHVAVGRVELLYPFPAAELKALVSRYPRLTEIVWVQEEPRNMGAWNFLLRELTQRVIGHRSLSYVARAESASPATGSSSVHKIEQGALLRRDQAQTKFVWLNQALPQQTSPQRIRIATHV